MTIVLRIVCLRGKKDKPGLVLYRSVFPRHKFSWDIWMLIGLKGDWKGSSLAYGNLVGRFIRIPLKIILRVKCIYNDLWVSKIRDESESCERNRFTWAIIRPLFKNKHMTLRFSTNCNAEKLIPIFHLAICFLFF